MATSTQSFASNHYLLVQSCAACLAVSISLSGVSAAGEQGSPCDDELRSVASPSGYQQRGKRCEGVYESDVSAARLEVFSLVRGPIQYPLTPATVLTITAPVLPLDDLVGPVQVRAAGPSKSYYRMDLTLEPGETTNWPVADVLLPQKLRADQIGVTGWISDPATSSRRAGRVIVPLRVAVVDSASSQPLEVTFRSSSGVEALKWRLAEDEASTWHYADLARAVPAGRPIRVVLPDGAPGVITLEVRYRPPGRDFQRKRRFRILRDNP